MSHEWRPKPAHGHCACALSLSDTAELMVELQEHGERPRYFAVRGCVTASSVVAAKAGQCASASGMADCRLMSFCTEDSLHGTQLGPGMPP